MSWYYSFFNLNKISVFISIKFVDCSFVESEFDIYLLNRLNLLILIIYVCMLYVLLSNNNNYITNL